MADIFSKKKRSEVMSRIRSKNSQAEKIIFSFLRNKNVYFQRHYARATGCPDVAVPRKKKAIFIDGDFWHGRYFKGKIKGRKAGDYWIEKIKSNVERDKKKRSALRRAGWSVIKVWESDILRKSTRLKQFSKIEKIIASKNK